MSDWQEDKPLAKKEVEVRKAFLKKYKKYNPTSYFELFPEEKSLLKRKYND